MTVARILLALSFLTFNDGIASKPLKAPRIEPLRILESYTLPIVEISGMAWRTNPETKKRELVIVGDRDHKIHVIDWAARKKGFDYREVTLQLEGASEQSEWESVFSDETGRVFIIQENPSQILVTSVDLKRVESRINLNVPKESKEGKVWHQGSNSGSEGLMPLKNGHVLVVKEKDPLRIFEFCPEGRVAEGYKAALSIETSGKFPLETNATIDLRAAFSWQLAPEHETLFEDSSGINVDEDGTLYLLGDQKNLIGRIGRTLKKNKAQIKIDRLWSLPSSIRQPEGMVIDSEGRPVIAVDQKNTKKPNIFLLSTMN